jgi:hypothetical protein
VRRAGYAVAAIGGAVLLLAVWVTSTSAIHLLPSGGSHQHHPAAVYQRLGHARIKGYHHGTEQPGGFQAALLDFGYVLMGLTAAGLLAFVLWAAFRKAKESTPPPSLRESPQDPNAIAALDVPPAILEAAERQLAALREGSPRNAIVACWMELERTCSQSGLPRSAAETSTEFTARVLSHYAIDAQAVSGLAGLYREARFSEHPLSEAHRDRAIAALQSVLADLRRARAARGLVPAR